MTVTMDRSAVPGAEALDLLGAEGVSVVSGPKSSTRRFYKESKLTRQTAVRTAR